jgi:hypothetical protein
VNHLVAEAI